MSTGRIPSDDTHDNSRGSMTRSVLYISFTGFAASDQTIPYFPDAGIVIELQNGQDRPPRDVRSEGKSDC